VTAAALRYCGTKDIKVGPNPVAAASTVVLTHEPTGLSLFGDVAVARHVCRLGAAYGRDAESQSQVRLAMRAACVSVASQVAPDWASRLRARRRSSLPSRGALRGFVPWCPVVFPSCRHHRLIASPWLPELQFPPLPTHALLMVCWYSSFTASCIVCEKSSVAPGGGVGRVGPRFAVLSPPSVVCEAVARPRVRPWPCLHAPGRRSPAPS
jgi:hypothetical protein